MASSLAPSTAASRRFPWQPCAPAAAGLLIGALFLLILGGCDRGDSQTAPQTTEASNQPEALNDLNETEASHETEASAETAASKLATAFELHRQEKPQAALKMVRARLAEAPEDPEALSLAVELHASLNQFCEAAELASSIAESDPPNASAILTRAADWYLRCGDFAAAEESLNRAVESEPANPQAHRLLAQILNGQGRRYEASEHVRKLIRLREATPTEVLSLVDLYGPFSLVSFEGIVDDTKTSLFTLGKARYHHVALDEKPETVLKLLDQVTTEFPENAAAAAFHGRVLAEIGRLDEFQDWLRETPEGVREHPEYWNAIGTWLGQQDRHREAIRAFGEALRRDPTDREALRSMIRSLDATGKGGLTLELRERLAALDRIFRIARDADPEQARWISGKLQELNRPWESAGWLMVAGQRSGNLRQYIPELNRRHLAITDWEQSASAERIREVRLKEMLGFKIGDWPMPDLGTFHAGGTPHSELAVSQKLRFHEVAQQVGISTQYDSGFVVDEGSFYPHQVNGGGLAALDYDLDGRCDLYVVQAGGEPNDPDGSTPNQLFRLLPELKYAEVSEPSRSGDRGFGQGVCAGDVNQDGFPDLIVANIGQNALYLNQGDGTFAESSGRFEDRADRWTSSVALADLNGDQLPEIIEVNYIDDPQAFQVQCEHDYMRCQPQAFRAAMDVVHRGRRDGTFTPWEAFSRAREGAKLGFGLVVANFDRQHGNDFFVSNDGDLNHFWTTAEAPDAGEEAFQPVESAGIRGCSIGRGGNSQACMGIASGDFDRDGTLDLHVTNFHNEPVNLFMQNQLGFFSDEPMKYRLADPSFDVLGFGTQSADFDNDGWADLAVLNGHVFDARHEGVPFRMAPQLFHGGREGFAVVEPSAAGPYWQQQTLGRTLALLDWNRDGRVDLLANHLDAPIALLQNDSPAEHWLALELVGVTSERDAVGAEVTVEAGEQTWTGWQTGGDGYMCTNEPVIHIGLGDSKTVDKVHVRWPDGQTQTFEDVQPDARYLVVQGQQQIVRRR